MYFCTDSSSRSVLNTSAKVSSGLSSVSATRLAVTQLVPVVQKLFKAGLASSTKKVYATGCKHYIEFCMSTQLSPFPTSEYNLQLFVGSLYQEGLSHGTIKSYLAAIRYDRFLRIWGTPAST